MLSGSYWGGIEAVGAPTIVTYSFPTSAPAYVAGVDGFTGATLASYQGFSAAEQTQARAALGEWAAASGLVFLEVAPGQGDLNFQLVDFDTTSAPSYAGAGGVAFYPFGDWNFFTYPDFSSDLDASGDVFMNTRYAASGAVNYGTLLHEIGHAIGLKHPTEVVTDYAADPDVTHDEVLSSDDPTRTIMATVGDGAPGGDPHLRQLDKDAAAYIYGVAGTGGVYTGVASGSNATSVWKWSSATQTLVQTGDADADTIRGSSVTDVINGMDGDDRLFGLAGDDRLSGGLGDDILHGGAGTDRMAGGAGDDSYFVDDGGDVVSELANAGYDSVVATVSWRLNANTELLQLIGSGLTGRGNDLGNVLYGDATARTLLYGFAGDDYLATGSGADLLNGNAGGDRMYGGAGDDVYYVDSVYDQVGEFAGEGRDRVYATADWTLGAGQEVEELRVMGAAGIALGGNERVNAIYGGAGADRLTGGGGADMLTGGGGNDVFAYGALSDSATGLGRDRIVDFTVGVDRIDLTGLEAATAQALTFTASSVFTHTAGELHARVVGGVTYVEADVDGNGSTNFQIRLDGVLSLHATDFIL